MGRTSPPTPPSRHAGTGMRGEGSDFVHSLAWRRGRRIPGKAIRRKVQQHGDRRAAQAPASDLGHWTSDLFADFDALAQGTGQLDHRRAVALDPDAAGAAVRAVLQLNQAAIEAE